MHASRGHSSTVIYALGSNSKYQLGLDHSRDVSISERCSFISGHERVSYLPLDKDEKVVKLVAGGNHTLLLTTHGQVWSTGLNDEGQRGLTSLLTTEALHTLRVFNEGTKPIETVSGWLHLPWTGPSLSDREGAFITDVAANWSVSYFVASSQRVYSCGLGQKGELGLGTDTLCTHAPQLAFDLRGFEDAEKTSVISISACLDHVVMLSSSGALYGWGASRRGQLGTALKDRKIVWQPQRIDLSLGWKPIQVVTGRDFTFVAGEKWSNHTLLGDAQRLGLEIPLTLGAHRESCSKGQTDPSLEGRYGFAAGWTSLVVRLHNGTVQTFSNPRRVPVSQTGRQPLPSIQVLESGSEHWVAITDEGKVVACGWGEHGNCGADIDARGYIRDGYSTIFEPSDGQRVLAISAGCATSFIVVEEPT